MAVPPVPQGYHSVTPYLVIDGATAAIAWYAKVFGAREHMRLATPEGKIDHAEIEIGTSRIMLSDEAPEHMARAPTSFGGSPVGLHLYIADVDAVMARAVAAGGTVRTPVEDKFYGDRMGGLVDPFGHVWYVSTHIEDVTEAEIARRLALLAPGAS